MSLSVDTSVWFSADLFTAMRATLGADRSLAHLKAHAVGQTVTHSHLRAEQVVDWSTRGGAKALGKDAEIGSLNRGKKADIVLIKNDDSPTMSPIVNPYGHVALQASRGDVHTVLVNGNVKKFANKLVGADLAGVRTKLEETVAFLQGKLGAELWKQGMNPDIPETRILDNPFMYTEYHSPSTHKAHEPAEEE